MRGSLAFVAVAAAVLIGTSPGAARTAQATIGVYPAGTSFTATGAAPRHAGSAVSLAMPINGVDDATILVRGAQHVSIQTPTIDSPLQLQLLWGHYVSIAGKLVPDALEPWDGHQRSTEKTNQPIWLQVTVPAGTAPGTYHGSVTVAAGGNPTSVAITVDVATVTIPPPGQVSGSLLTAFNFSAQSYGAVVNKLYSVPARQSLPGLFSFLASYRISPNNWGYGNPNSKSGYTARGDWYHNKVARMIEAGGNPRQFSSMWIPVSNNRSIGHDWVAGLSPYAPSTWCSYLKSVRNFWTTNGWLPGAYPYLYGMDEAGTKLFPVVAKQAAVTHTCWPGSHVLLTGKPSSRNRILWNGGKDDVDTWAVLESRYYGEYYTPGQQRRHENRPTMFLRNINAARKRGKQIWTYTYRSRAHATPGLAGNEPVADARMFVEWAALEGITGLLRGQGMTSYTLSTNPLVSNNRDDGDMVLIYPGKNAPIASARLEELREGIEDWEILNIVRHDKGSKAVVKLLSGLFSTTSTGAKLACFIGCAIKNSKPYSWPLWSKTALTAAKIEQMRVKALAAAS